MIKSKAVRNAKFIKGYENVTVNVTHNLAIFAIQLSYAKLLRILSYVKS